MGKNTMPNPVCSHREEYACTGCGKCWRCCECGPSAPRLMHTQSREAAEFFRLKANALKAGPPYELKRE
jgi:hypothetical protein